MFAPGSTMTRNGSLSAYSCNTATVLSRAAVHDDHFIGTTRLGDQTVHKPADGFTFIEHRADDRRGQSLSTSPSVLRLLVVL